MPRNTRYSQKTDNDRHPVTQFEASLTLSNDAKPLPITADLGEGSLALVSGGEEIGQWQLDQVNLQRILGGYRFDADGETVTLKIAEADRFADELDRILHPPTPTKKRSKKEEKAKKTEIPSTEVASVDDRSKPQSAKAKRVKEPKAPKTPKAPKASGQVGWLDTRLEALDRRWGRYLPAWILTKGGLLVVLGILVALVAKPAWFSALFLIVAAVGLMASAVAMVDQVVAIKIFKGRYSAVQGLLVSLGIGLVGLLLGALK